MIATTTTVAPTSESGEAREAGGDFVFAGTIIALLLIAGIVLLQVRRARRRRDPRGSA